MMTRHQTRLPIICFASLLCAACGRSGKTPATSNAGNATTTAQTPSGGAAGLARFEGDRICDILSKSSIDALFSPQAPVQSKASTRGHRVSCYYHWPRPDAEQRRKAATRAMMDSLRSGKTAKLNPRAMSTKFSISISISPTRATAKTFVPRKLTERELQARTDRVARRTQQHLTDAQKRIIGANGTHKLAEGMLRKVNERIVVEGIGDAAYWLPTGLGSLHVLLGNRRLIITPDLADNQRGDLAAAKRIYAAIGH